MRIRRSTTALVSAGLVLLGTAGVTAATTVAGAGVAAATTPAFKFNPGLPLLDDKGANTGAAEPSIDVDEAGNAYVMGPDGVPNGGCPFWTVHPGTFNKDGLPYDYRGKPDLQPVGVGGGDCDIAHGSRVSQNADHVAVSSLSLGNLTTSTSDDRGKTFKPANDVGGTQVFGDDRQWQAVDHTLNINYLTVHDVATDNIQVSVSNDGGYQYVSNTPAISDPNALAASTQNNHFTPPVVDERTHKIYEAWVSPATAAENVAAQQQGADPNEHAVWLAVGDPCAVSCPKGGPIGPISWTDYLLYQAPSGQDLDEIFPTIAIDHPSTNGGTVPSNVYIGWMGDTSSSTTNRFQMITVKTDDPSHFTGPISLDSGKNHSNMFPWLVAGKTGIVDAAWYGGTLVGSGSTCPSGATGTPDDSNGVNNNCFNQWRVQFAQVTKANTNTPVVTRSNASGINHKGSICDQGLNCSLFGGDRTLLDFFDMDLDPGGAANIAYVQDPSQIVYTRQCYGKSAQTGKVISRSCGPFVPPQKPVQPVCGSGANHLATVVTDASGDSSNPSGGPSNGDVDATAVTAADAGANIDVTLKVATLTDPATPPPGTSDIYYYATWTGPDGKQYAVEHDEPEPGTKTYTVGQFDPSTNQMVSGTTTAVTGSYTAGTPGTITWHVPKTLVGNATVPVSSASSAALGNPYTVISVGEGVLGTGLVFTQPADRGPNNGFGSSWAVCP